MGTRLNPLQFDDVNEWFNVGAGCLMGFLGRVFVSQIPKFDTWIRKLGAQLKHVPKNRKDEDSQRR
jgi:hypothetical protein